MKNLTRLEGSHLKIIKALNIKLTARITQNGKKLKASPFGNGTKQRYLLQSLLFTLVLLLLARAIAGFWGCGKRNKGYQKLKGESQDIPVCR